jgi:hypothetical protein
LEFAQWTFYLIDGTYKLFRCSYALPSARDESGKEVAAVRGVLSSMLGNDQGWATHIAIATDHVIESFRNELWSGYKDSGSIIGTEKHKGSRPVCASRVATAHLPSQGRLVVEDFGEERVSCFGGMYAFQECGRLAIKGARDDVLPFIPERVS